MLSSRTMVRYRSSLKDFGRFRASIAHCNVNLCPGDCDHGHHGSVFLPKEMCEALQSDEHPFASFYYLFPSID